MLSWWSVINDTWCKELTHWKRPWCWEGLGAGGEGDDRGWDGWMASLTQRTRVWVNSGSWWWTGRPGVLRFMGLHRVRHDWATELNWCYCSNCLGCNKSYKMEDLINVYSDCSTASCPTSFPFFGLPYSLRYNNFEIRPANNTTMASTCSRGRESHRSLTLNQKQEIIGKQVKNLRQNESYASCTS